MKVFPLILFSLLFLCSAAGAKDRPNIIIMMVDDLGFSDFGCYGSEIKTPHIDGLAKNGLRFSRFYNTAKCHSSRVSLLTGLYCDQAGSETLKRGVTIAEVLQKSGYSTAMVGKWHLQKEPTDRGFEKYFGHLSGATNFFTGDNTFRLNGKPWNDFDEDFYTTNAFIDYAGQFLDEMLAESPEKPFFLYVAHNAPHYPLHVLEEDYRKYEGVYDEGWDIIRERRQKKQIAEGLIPESWTPAPRPENVPAWKDLTEKEKKWDNRRMTAFAGMVDRIDETTGRLIGMLKEKKVFDNTLILICSDNGACPFDRTRGAEFEPWDSRSYWCYDTGWSHVGNTPFRLHKQNQHEGGISSPLIAHWPEGITAEAGSITDQPGHLIDFMATALDLAGADYPESWPGRELEPLQGKSLTPILKGKIREPHEFLYFRFASNRAIRKGKWKLVTHRSSQWELYDIEQDGTEMNNLAEQYPEKVKELADLWTRTARGIDHQSQKNTKPVSGKTPPGWRRTVVLRRGRPSQDWSGGEKGSGFCQDSCEFCYGEDDRVATMLIPIGGMRW